KKTKKFLVFMMIPFNHRRKKGIPRDLSVILNSKIESVSISENKYLLLRTSDSSVNQISVEHNSILHCHGQQHIIELLTLNFMSGASICYTQILFHFIDSICKYFINISGNG